MSSQLPAIVSAVGALSVTVPASIAYAGNKTPQVFALSTLPNEAPDARLPCRLIRMLRSTDAGAQAFDVVFGNETIARVGWRIYDQLLWRSLQQGLGLGSHEADLIKYCAAYVDALQTLPEALSLPTATSLRSRLLGVTMTVSEVNFPLGSEYWFAGVEVALDIEERLVGTSPAAWS